MSNYPKYRLKKDTPEFEAGQMFTRGEDEYGNDCLFAGSAPLPAFDVSSIDNFDKWFEEVKESGWWKPKNGVDYYYVNDDGVIVSREGFLSMSTTDDKRLSIGNAFRSKAAAERYCDYLKAIAMVRQDEGVLTPEQINERIKNDDLAYYVGYMGNRGNGEVLCGCVVDFEDCWMPVGAILFDSEVHADRSLCNHPDEWKIIVNYDWSRE